MDEWNGWMGGRASGRADGRTDGCDGRMDGRADGRTEIDFIMGTATITLCAGGTQS